MKAILLAFISTFLSTTSQVLWKIAIQNHGGLIKEGVPLLKGIFELAITPFIIIGGLMYLLSGVAWLYLLEKYDFSQVFPMLALSYILAFIYGIFIFHEPISVYRWIGVILIITGVFFIAK